MTPTLINTINVYSDGSVVVTPATPPPARTLPVVVRTPYAPAPGAQWPAYSTANPNCAWFTAIVNEVPDTLTPINQTTPALPTSIPNGSELILGSGTYTLSGTLVMSGTNQAISGITGETTIQWTGPAGGTMIELSGSGLTVQGLEFIGPAGNVFAGNGDNFIIVSCSTPGVASNPATFANFADTGGPGVGGPINWSIVNCVVGVVAQYGVFFGGTNGTIMASEFGGSLNQDVVRGTGVNILIENNTIINTLATIAYQGGSHCSIIANTLYGPGALSLGPILTPQAVNPPLCQWTQVAGNLCQADINVNPGCVGTSIFEGTITATPVGITINGPTAGFTLDVEQLWMYGVTIDNDGPNGTAIKFNSGWTKAAGVQAWITECMTMQPNVTIGPGDYYSASVTALCPDLSQIKFSGNKWGKPAGYNGVPAGNSFLVGGDTAASFYTGVPAGDIQE